MRDESDGGRVQAAIAAIGMTPQNLHRHRIAVGIPHFDALDFWLAESHLGFHVIGSVPTQKIENRQRCTGALRVYLRKQGVKIVAEHLVTQTLGEVVTREHILIDVIEHDTRTEIVGLIEEHRIPGALDLFSIRAGSASRQHAGFLHGCESALHIAHPAFKFDACAVHALKQRIQIAHNHRQLIRMFCSARFEIRGGADLDGERIRLIAIPLFHVTGKQLIGIADVSAGEQNSPLAMPERREVVETGFHGGFEGPECRQVLVEGTISGRQPMSGDGGAVDALPGNICGCLWTGDAALKPVGVHSGEAEDLRHLGIVAEGVESPSGVDFIAETIAKIPFRKQELMSERFARRNVFIFHHDRAAGDFKPVLVEHLFEDGNLVRVALEKRTNVGALIEHVVVIAGSVA